MKSCYFSFTQPSYCEGFLQINCIHLTSLFLSYQAHHQATDKTCLSSELHLVQCYQTHHLFEKAWLAQYYNLFCSENKTQILKISRKTT